MPRSEYVTKRLGYLRNAAECELISVKLRRGHHHAPPRCTYGVRAEVIAERCGVDVPVARSWKAGISRMPRTAIARFRDGARSHE